MAVASNSKYKEMAFDGFEDYDFSTCLTSAHFNFQGLLKPNEITVSSKQSHTGRKSLKVEAGKSALLKKQVVSCIEVPSNTVTKVKPVVKVLAKDIKK